MFVTDREFLGRRY